MRINISRRISVEANNVHTIIEEAIKRLLGIAELQFEVLDAGYVVLLHHVAGEGNATAVRRMANNGRDEVVSGIVAVPFSDNWTVVRRHRHDDVPGPAPFCGEEEVF